MGINCHAGDYNGINAWQVRSLSILNKADALSMCEPPLQHHLHVWHLTRTTNNHTKAELMDIAHWHSTSAVNQGCHRMLGTKSAGYVSKVHRGVLPEDRRAPMARRGRFEGLSWPQPGWRRIRGSRLPAGSTGAPWLCSGQGPPDTAGDIPWMLLANWLESAGPQSNPPLTWSNMQTHGEHC